MIRNHIRWVYLAIVLTSILLAGWSVHVRTQSTLIGYELGLLKKREAKLLEERSRLQTEQAVVTTKKYLSKAAGISEKPTSSKQ